MNLSRRLFLGGLATVAAVAASPLRPYTPVLWGDGVHDDAPALNAWIRGEPVRILRERTGLSGERYAISDATLGLRSPLFMPKGAILHMSNTTLLTLPGFEGRAVVIMPSHASLSGFHIDASSLRFDG